MSLSRRQLLHALTVAGSTALTWRSASAQDIYPSKPLRFVIPFAAGGPADIVSRLVGTRLQEQLGQAVVMDNLPGAGSTLGVGRLAKMPADGYAIGFAHTGSMAIGPQLYKNVGYDPLRDLTPIARLCNYVNLLVVNANSPYRTLADLLAAARATPGALTYGSAGISSSNHLSGELLAMKAGVSMTHVPYRGSALAMNELLAGGLQFMFDAPNTSTPLLRAGRLRALGTTGRERHPKFPDLPTIAETVPGYDYSGWGGLLVPKATPRAIQDKLRAALVKAVESKEVKDAFARQGADAVTNTSQEFRALVADEIKNIGPVVKAAGLKVE